MKAEIKDGILRIEIPVQEPRASASGKTLVIATSSGNRPTTAQVNGQQVVIGLNAYIKR